MRAAVIGIGSNSVRMLVAEAADGEIRRISRDRAGTRLFAGLDEAGNLSREAMASSCAAVKRMADSARSQGAEKVHLFATSATRDAANNADFAALLKAETGLTLEICSGDEEAALTGPSSARRTAAIPASSTSAADQPKSSSGRG